MSGSRIARHKTAIGRTDLSKPMRSALEDGALIEGFTVMDYGCGRGDDLTRLRAQGYTVNGWDPGHDIDGRVVSADLVNLGYVVNVIEDPEERADVLQTAWNLAKKVLVVSARHNMEMRGAHLNIYGDGFLTTTNTFQKFYSQDELKSWIDEVLSEDCIPAAPGIFYVFRDNDLRESIIAARYRRRVTMPRLRRSDVLFQQHKDLLEVLMNFYSTRGRLPRENEIEQSQEIKGKLGSLKRAFLVIHRVTSIEQWEEIQVARSEDLLVYLSLARFGKRPKFSHLPRAIQLDVRAFFSSYKRACELADFLLFSAGHGQIINEACRDSELGKMTGNALYVHKSALAKLSPVLRVYEGCARNFIGEVEDANIIKLHRDKAAVSYLAYPDFDKKPHPELHQSLHVALGRLRANFTDYTNRANPPILHRKEEFVAGNYPHHDKFSTLTKQEEKWGLYERPASIGTSEGWQQVLKQKGVKLSGHRVVRRKQKTTVGTATK